MQETKLLICKDQAPEKSHELFNEMFVQSTNQWRN